MADGGQSQNRTGWCLTPHLLLPRIKKKSTLSRRPSFFPRQLPQNPVSLLPILFGRWTSSPSPSLADLQHPDLVFLWLSSQYGGRFSGTCIAFPRSSTAPHRASPAAQQRTRASASSRPRLGS